MRDRKAKAERDVGASQNLNLNAGGRDWRRLLQLQGLRGADTAAISKSQ